MNTDLKILKKWMKSDESESLELKQASQHAVRFRQGDVNG